jgi:hypothetical protein
MPYKIFSSYSKLLFGQPSRSLPLPLQDFLLAGNVKRPLQDNYNGREGIFQIIFLKA